MRVPIRIAFLPVFAELAQRDRRIMSPPELRDPVQAQRPATLLCLVRAWTQDAPADRQGPTVHVRVLPFCSIRRCVMSAADKWITGSAVTVVAAGNRRPVAPGQPGLHR